MMRVIAELRKLIENLQGALQRKVVRVILLIEGFRNSRDFSALSRTPAARFVRMSRILTLTPVVAVVLVLNGFFGSKGASQ
jgi:hypothetical protein